MKSSDLDDPDRPIGPDRIERVRAGLLAWFAANRRDLPWRETRDPYRIMISEVMLQQTQVDRVIPYYNAWLDRFPTVADLATAPTAEVIRMWAGLGYNRRAVNLQRAAKYVVEQLAGAFPTEVAALQALPGIGPYTAGAIACFAFERDVAFLDTNMRRTLHRIFFGVDVPAQSASERELLAVAVEILPEGQGWVWNQALIEFGALHCTARRPACVVCPVQAECQAFPEIQSAIARLPAGSRRKQDAPFSGSSRYYRGRVMNILRDLDETVEGAEIDLPTLGPRLRDDFSQADVPWLYELVQGLARDGLAQVAEEKAAYDLAEAGDVPKVRVRLP